MKIRKLLRGQFLIKCIQMESLHETDPRYIHHDKVCIVFYRKGRWSIFGWRTHQKHSYVRKYVPERLTRILRRNSNEVFLNLHRATSWFVQYDFNKPFFELNGNVITLAYLLYLLYVILGI